MKKIEMLKNKIKSLREEAGQDGFSLLELVVAVGILLVLTVGGLLAYNGITDNARQAAVDSAASEIYTAASAAEADNDPDTDAYKVGDEWEASQKGGSADGTFSVDSGLNADGEVVVIVENKDKTQFSTQRGEGTIVPKA